MALKRFGLDLASLSAGRMVQTLAAFLALPIIARLLGPHEYGLVAVAMSFVLGTIFLADAGLGQSLVRTPASETETWSSAFWLMSAFGAGLCLLLCLIALAAPAMFGEPRLGPLLLALAPVPLLVSVLAAPTADMQQRQRFRELAAIEVFCALGGLATAFALALNGAGAWALVCQQLAFWVMKAALLGWRTRFRPRLVFSTRNLAEHARFGRDTVGATLVYFLGRQLDPLVLARMLGAASTGLYAFATRVMNLPHQLVASPVQNALYVRMVELRQDPAALRDLLLILTTGVALLVFPAIATLAVASPAYFNALLSREWVDAAPLFTLLAPTAAVQTILVPVTALLLATGRTGVRFRMTAEMAVLWVIGLPISALYGLWTVAAAFTAISLLYVPRALLLSLPAIGLTIAHFLSSFIPATIAAAGICAVHLIVRSNMPMTDLQEIAVSLCELTVAYGVLLLACRSRLRVQVKTLRTLIARSAGAAAAA
jgi:O-antigen/teichoic acid export membrane protein